MMDIILPLKFYSKNFLLYKKKVNKFPNLQLKEEQKLLKIYIKNNNINAVYILVTSHLKLVIKIALKFDNYGLPVMDLISEGNFGLMKAIKKFCPNKKTRLSTYSILWIKSFIQNYILKSISLIKKNSYFKNKKLNINKSNYIYNVKTISLNKNINDNNTLIDVIENIEKNQEETFIDEQEKRIRLKKLYEALNKLSDKEKYIINNRKLSTKPLTLNQLSKKYLVSSERIRQIEQMALNKIKNFLIKE